MDEVAFKTKEGRIFRAFISYRHLDNTCEGRRWAEWLHHGLENYQIPKSLRGRPNRLNRPIPGTLYPIFRDEEEMGAAKPLGELVEAGLQQSEWLIVLCSSQSAESPWLNREVDRFRELGKGDRILLVLLEGEPDAQARSAAGEPIDPALECLPRALRIQRLTGTVPGTEETAGAWLASYEQELAIDFRIEGTHEEGYTSAGAYRTALELKNDTLPFASRPSKRQLRTLEDRYAERLKLLRLKLIAGLLNVDLAELTRRDAEARARRARIIATISVVVALFVTFLGAWAVWQGYRRQQLLKEASRADFAEAQRLARRGEWQSAVAHLDRALHYWPENAAAAAQIWLILRHESGPSLAVPEREFIYPYTPTDAKFSPDGGYLAATDSEHGLSLFVVNKNEQPRVFAWPNWDFQAFAFARAPSRLVVVGENPNWRIIDLNTHSESVSPDTAAAPFFPPDTNGFSPLAPDGSKILTYADETLEIFDVTLGKSDWKIPSGGGSPVFAAWSGDGKILAAAWDTKEVRLYDCSQRASREPLIKAPGDVLEIVINTEGDAMAVRYRRDPHTNGWNLYRLSRPGQPLALPDDSWWVKFVPHASSVIYRTQENRTFLRDYQSDESSPSDLRLSDCEGALCSEYGRKVVLHAFGGVICPIDVAHPSRAFSHQTLGDGGDVLAVSADGNILASAEKGIISWSLPDYLATPPAPPPDLKPDFVSESPDETWQAATVLQSGIINYHGKLSEPFAIQWYLNPSAKVAWSKDGHTLWHYPQWAGTSGGAIPWAWQPPREASEAIRRACILLSGVEVNDSELLVQPFMPMEKRLRWREAMESASHDGGEWKPFLEWWLNGRR